MSAIIRSIDKAETALLISANVSGTLSEEDKHQLHRCLSLTNDLWVGMCDDELLAAWGLIPPTLLSNRAYLWLYTTPHVGDHTFVFVRQSQRALENMLHLYPIIEGHTRATAEDSIRWLKWLGAKYGEPQSNGLIPFEIRAKEPYSG